MKGPESYENFIVAGNLEVRNSVLAMKPCWSSHRRFGIMFGYVSAVDLDQECRHLHKEANAFHPKMSVLLLECPGFVPSALSES